MRENEHVDALFSLIHQNCESQISATTVVYESSVINGRKESSNWYLSQSWSLLLFTL